MHESSNYQYYNILKIKICFVFRDRIKSEISNLTYLVLGSVLPLYTAMWVTRSVDNTKVNATLLRLLFVFTDWQKQLRA
jgi:hypothetical protein